MDNNTDEVHLPAKNPEAMYPELASPLRLSRINVTLQPKTEGQRARRQSINPLTAQGDLDSDVNKSKY